MGIYKGENNVEQRGRAERRARRGGRRVLNKGGNKTTGRLKMRRDKRSTQEGKERR